MGSSCFFLICFLHSALALTSGSLMLFYSNEIYVLCHGQNTAVKLKGSTPHDQLLIQTSDSFSGLLLFTIGFLVFMVSCVKDWEFQNFFAKGCVLLHISMAVWRFHFERKLEDLAYDWPRHAVGDIALAVSWVFFLVYMWSRGGKMDGWTNPCPNPNGPDEFNPFVHLASTPNSLKMSNPSTSI